jgi:exosortase
MVLKLHKGVAVSLLILTACTTWALWPALVQMQARWAGDPRYAHGYLVPLFASALLWMRRSRLPWFKLADKGAEMADLPDPKRRSKPKSGVRVGGRAWGLAIVGLGATIQLVGAYYRIDSLEGLALLPYLAGICVLLGGWPALDWAWPSIAFLAFMIPLPWRLENALGPPLQSIATVSSTYLLQTLGFMAFAEGNIIQLNEARIGVVEACSGLSMLITFIALSTAAALVVNRPLLDRVVLVLSSIPVALLSNIIRITVTGILHDTVSGHAADTFYHDLAGWLMIPLALLLYWLELWILSHILVETKRQAPLPLDILGARRRENAVVPAKKGYSPSVL